MDIYGKDERHLSVHSFNLSSSGRLGFPTSRGSLPVLDRYSALTNRRSRPQLRRTSDRLSEAAAVAYPNLSIPAGRATTCHLCLFPLRLAAGRASHAPGCQIIDRRGPSSAPLSPTFFFLLFYIFVRIFFFLFNLLLPFFDPNVSAAGVGPHRRFFFALSFSTPFHRRRRRSFNASANGSVTLLIPFFFSRTLLDYATRFLMILVTIYEARQPSIPSISPQEPRRQTPSLSRSMCPRTT